MKWLGGAAVLCVAAGSLLYFAGQQERDCLRNQMRFDHALNCDVWFPGEQDGSTPSGVPMDRERVLGNCPDDAARPGKSALRCPITGTDYVLTFLAGEHPYCSVHGRLIERYGYLPHPRRKPWFPPEVTTGRVVGFLSLALGILLALATGVAALVRSSRTQGRTARPHHVRPREPRATMTDNPARPPRFPHVAALLCAACFGAAVWTWMRYSYAWEMTPTMMAAGQQLLVEHGARKSDRGTKGDITFEEFPSQAYVCATGRIRRSSMDKDGNWWDAELRIPVEVHAEGFPTSLKTIDRHTVWTTFQEVAVKLLGPGDTPWRRNDCARPRFVGRLCVIDRKSPARTIPFQIDATASRWHGASISGLVVGAMGVFVFTVALRHWLMERRRFREATEGA